MRFTVKTNGTVDLAAKLANTASKAAHAVAIQMEKDTRPYVPFLTGALNNSTRVVGDTVIYSAPYVRFLYYGKVMIDPETGSTFARKGATKVVTDKDLVFTKDFHPQAQAFWCEASKAQNLEKWKRVAQKAVNHFGE